MSKNLGSTEKLLLKAMKKLRDKSDHKVTNILVFSTFKQIYIACQDDLTKEQVHCALWRLVNRGTIWKSTDKKPQIYWILPGNFKIILE